QATFSHCFGAPFMVHHPMVYAKLLGERIAKHEVDCWLVNTGWSGGPYGIGKRMKLPYTRAMIDAALAGKLTDVEFSADPIFKVAIPRHVPGVPDEVLDPRSTWSDPAAYDAKARELARLFADNFKKFESAATPDVLAAAPKTD
ncbi:MAG: phosphoenolpyruvate carboxykinase (ATP), partial [Candidatus Eremiobacteraeota bacterium]|nr:phosphoenolpyruvate carboxykinase (ATP) [Candidatus Eremiobacteraeota bacterium]